MNSETTTPTLAPPGAGLPWLELQAAKLIFHRAKKKSSRDKANALLREEAEIMKKYVGSVSPELAGERVLIDRLRGLEDSSRYWSIFMTLEHLAIVNEAIVGILTALSSGVVPLGVANTAAVKPHPGTDATVLPRFLSSVEAVSSTSLRIPDLETALRYEHPWFGALNAAEWHFLSAFHQQLHRKQIEAILRKLLG